MIPCLPQRDAQPDRRAAAVASDRVRYRLDRSLHGLPFPTDLPAEERFDLRFFSSQARLNADVLRNAAQARIEIARTRGVNPRGIAKGLLDRLRTVELRAIWEDPVERRRIPEWDERDPLTVGEHRHTLQTLPHPPMVTRWQDDDFFAWQRIAGMSPVLLTHLPSANVAVRLRELRAQAPGYAAVYPDDSLEAAGQDGRLFVHDLEILDGISYGPAHGFRKFLGAPIGLFALSPDRARLRPVAIRCEREGDWFDPAGGAGWQMAKTWFQAADSAYHGMVEHATLCHIVIGGLGVCAYRTLAPNHPIRCLLRPHLDLTLAIDEATRGLFEAGGRAPTLQGFDLHGGIALAQRALQQFDWWARTPPREFSDRGVLESSVLPEYPYRDDILPYWDALLTFVDHALSMHYVSDDDVASDPELQAFLDELRSDDCMGIASIGVVEDRETLIQFLASVLWRASPYHAVINYGVWPFMGFAAGGPTASYAPAPKGGTTYDAVDHLLMLPPLDQVLRQIADVWPVGHTRLNRLGQYAPGALGDPRAEEAVAGLQMALERLERQIHERNRSRLVPYELLLPSLVTASIHI
jgi:arachidonate 15-lipoxygenase